MVQSSTFSGYRSLNLLTNITFPLRNRPHLLLHWYYLGSMSSSFRHHWGWSCCFELTWFRTTCTSLMSASGDSGEEKSSLKRTPLWYRRLAILCRSPFFFGPGKSLRNFCSKHPRPLHPTAPQLVLAPCSPLSTLTYEVSGLGHKPRMKLVCNIKSIFVIS